MDMETLFRWIHISDIHVGHGDAEHGWDQKLVMAVLLKDIDALVRSKHKPIDAVFVTGDIAFSGNGRRPTEYEEATSWFGDLASAAGVKPANIYVVPGNHDVDRSADKDRSTRRLIDALRKADDKLDNALADRGDRALLTHRMGAYLAFSDKFAPACQRAKEPPEERLFWNELLMMPQGLKVRILGLNTALLAADDEDRGKLRLGKAQLLPLTRTADELVMVLSHHPFADGWLADQQETDAWVRNHAHVHLSGHVHEADAEASRKGSGGVFVRVVAGSVHGDQGAPAGHGYSFGAIVRGDDGKARLQVWPRKWAARRAAFVLDVENVQDGEQYSMHDLRFVPPPSSSPPKPAPKPVAKAPPSPSLLAEPPDLAPADGPVNVFISYVPEDEALEKKLETHLRGPSLRQKINLTSSRSVEAGEDSRVTIERHLASAHIILLLLSADYLASPQGYDFEMQVAKREREARGAHVIPVMLRAISVGDSGPLDDNREWFLKLVHLPRNGEAVELWQNKDAVMTHIADEIRSLVSRLGKAAR